MAVHAGHLSFDQEHGSIVLLTARDGLAAQVGHDLVIGVGAWSAQLEVTGDLSAAADLTVRIDMNSLIVREGRGGAMALTDKDRRDIAVTIRKVLSVDRHPEATFTAPAFEPGPDGGGALNGMLTLAGARAPVGLEVSRTGPDSYHATGSVRQSDLGIKPYRAFLGALKVSDAVRIAVDVTLPGSEPGDGKGTSEDRQ